MGLTIVHSITTIKKYQANGTSNTYNNTSIVNDFVSYP